MNIIKTINFENVEEKEYKDFRTRNTARAIVFDNENNIALLHVTSEGFHKLPGGGIDEGESELDCVIREVSEESKGLLKETLMGELKAYRNISINVRGENITSGLTVPKHESTIAFRNVGF